MSLFEYLMSFVVKFLEKKLPGGLDLIVIILIAAPLRSMSLTAMLGLTGAPMAIGALSVFSSPVLNLVLFRKIKFGSKKDTISVSIETLTQAHIITTNPIPVYITNFIGGSLCGIIMFLMGLTNMPPGTATPIAGFAVMFAYNPAFKVLLTSLFCVIVIADSGYIEYMLFKN